MQQHARTHFGNLPSSTPGSNFTSSSTLLAHFSFPCNGCVLDLSWTVSIYLSSHICKLVLITDLPFVCRPDLFIEDTLMSAPAQPLPPNQPHPSSSSAVSRSISRARHDKHDSSHDPHESSTPSSPLQSQDEVDEPQTPKAGSSTPLPSSEDSGRLQEEEEKIGTNPWMTVLRSAVDHDDEHVTKVGSHPRLFSIETCTEP